MIGTALLCLTTLHLHGVAAQGECTDFRGRVISHGLHYVPGPDTCTLCVCDNGIPKVCKAVLCSPPQDCRSFRVGNTCCEFICLDDVVKPAEGTEANVRVAAGGAATIVLLTVALVVYRVRKQKRRRPPHADDQRSLTSIGYISGSMGYMGGTCETALAAWKPPGNYLPRGEAPPPYDEAVAQCRPESVRMGNETPFHRTYPSTVETLTRAEDAVQCAGHAYVNIPRPVQQIANTQNCYNAPLLQPVHPPEAREPNPITHHPLTANVIGFPSAIRLTGSLGAISNRGLLSVAAREPDHERPHNVPGFYTNTPNMHTSLHRTIPRISAAAEGALGASLTRALHAEVRRSFHRSDRPDRPDRPARPDARSMPRNLNLADDMHDMHDLHDMHDVHEPPLLDQSIMRLAGSRSLARSSEQNVGLESAPPPPALAATAPAALAPAAPAPAPPPPCAACAAPAHVTHVTHATHATHAPAPPPHANVTHVTHGNHATHGTHAPAPPPHATLPLTIDKPSCVCSYEGSNAPGTEDADDYRSECENCKSASSSRWVLEEGWEAEEGDGTQTLQRRAPPPAPAPPATNTLPQPVTKPSRNMMGPPSNWENWFNTIPDSDTESEEE